uniref:DNA-directed RNA polymerase n=1 Tax=Mycena chlorophos TaxID=658473 RepID=A0ABQ0LNX6_MYCCL|nr:mitochondrial RNA polymerase [Mycena chlorophos]
MFLQRCVRRRLPLRSYTTASSVDPNIQRLLQAEKEKATNAEELNELNVLLEAAELREVVSDPIIQSEQPLTASILAPERVGKTATDLFGVHTPTTLQSLQNGLSTARLPLPGPLPEDATEEEFAATLVRGRSIHRAHQHARTYLIPAAQIQFRSHDTKLMDLFIHFATHAAASLGIPCGKPFILPTQRSMWTVIRSPFAGKKSQENFERKVHRKGIKAWDADPAVVDLWFRYLRKHAMGGVGIRCVKWERMPIGVGAGLERTVKEKLHAKTQVQSRIKRMGEQISPPMLTRACRRVVHRRGGAPSSSSGRRSVATALAKRRDELQSFLERPAPIAMLPPPLPQNFRSSLNDVWFTNSATQEMLAIMDACLHNLYDVPRAKTIFERLRDTDSGAIDSRVVNAMLEAYLKTASQSDTDYWVEALWELFNSMVEPTAPAFAIALLATYRHPPLSPLSLTTLLAEMVRQDASVLHVVSDRVLTDEQEAAQLVAELSRSAIELNLPSVVAELAEANAIAVSELEEDEQVAEARPVTKELDKSVPFNLATLRKHLTSTALARKVLPNDLMARQKLLEDGVFDAAKERLARQSEVFERFSLQSNILQQPDLQRWMWQWHLLLTERLENEIKAIVAADAGHEFPNGSYTYKNTLISPYLSTVKPERLSLITIIEIMRLSGTGGVAEGMKTARALITVGKAVEYEYKSNMARINRIDVPSSNAPLNYFTNMGYKNLQERRVLAAKLSSDSEGWSAPWTQTIRTQVGSVLVECLMDVAQVTRTAKNKFTDEFVTEDQPAFYQSYEYQRGQKLGVLRLNPAVADRLAKDPMPLHPRHLPMLVRPKPWIDFNKGGYLNAKNSAMRFKDSMEQRSYLKYAADNGHVELVFQGLDVLGSTPWRINRRIFDVVLEVWNSGKRLGKIPPEVFDQPEPEPLAENETDMYLRNAHISRQKQYNQAKAANHSDRCSVNYKIEISRSFLNDVFYLPHNVDFRGRAYPIPPHLNHIGDDLSRGLLIFADKKPLGERGFRWLKIHLSNVFGFDKANFDERVAFTEAHMDDIYDAVLNPLTGRGWWQKADDPWQCLATCMELHAAIESGDPLTYESALPVHQDGTCNGLQHYAALGGDEQGAQQVNLTRTERPSDVYSFVGQMVEKDIAAAAEKGDPTAKLLQGKITRKIVKQTVMTTVYGVTFIGARDQIEKQLRDFKIVPDEQIWQAATFLARRVLAAIGDLFQGAKGIMNWLNLCARLIAKSIPGDRLPEALGELQLKRKRLGRKAKALPEDHIRREQMTSVVWTTPLGLPICQPYRKIARKQIYTNLQSVYISDPSAPAEVNASKQASAFPPNFIHSLDATHMMLTAIECNVQGLTFASVHDSYWTHACSVDEMSSIIRATFIALHSSDVLEKLREEFLTRYSGFQIPLYHLRSPSLQKMMRAAGARIRATPEQAASLRMLSDIVEVTEDEDTTVSTQKVYEGEEMESMVSRMEKESLDAHEEESDVEEAEAAENNKKRGRPRKVPTSETRSEQKKRQQAQAVAELMGKFVDVTDLLPPLPPKGTFDVQDIKDSPYFFS